MTDRNDAARVAGERDAAIAEELTKDAVSRVLADAMDPPASWPKNLGWSHSNFGVLIETEHGHHTVAPDAQLRPSEVIGRLIHPGFARWHREGGAVHWC